MSAALPSLLPTCFPGDVGCYAKEAAQSAFESIVKAIGEGVVTMVKFLSTFWLSVPSPVVATGSGNSWSMSSVIGQMQAWIGPVTGSIALVSFAVAITRIAWTSNGGEARHLLRQVSAVGAGSLVVVAGTELLIRAGDAFSPWIIQRASGGRSPSEGLRMLISSGLASGQPATSLGLWFVIFLVCTIGAIVQCVFMIVRGAALMVLMVFVPPSAAATASEEGWARFKRLALLIIGFALYKPVAAIIYAVGIMEMTQNTHATSGNDIQNAMYGLTIMVMAAVALPAFIKFLMPAAAMGSSSAFSGAAAMGVVAAGAAIVATGGWGAASTGGAAGTTGAAGASGASGAAAAVPPAAPPPSGSGSSGGGGSGSPGGGGAESGSAGGRSWAGGIGGVGQSGAGHVADAEPEEGAA